MGCCGSKDPWMIKIIYGEKTHEIMSHGKTVWDAVRIVWSVVRGDVPLEARWICSNSRTGVAMEISGERIIERLGVK